MNIDEFINTIKIELDTFATKWKSNHSRGDEKLDNDITYQEAYPLDMNEEEWFEHFMIDQTTGELKNNTNIPPAGIAYPIQNGTKWSVAVSNGKNGEIIKKNLSKNAALNSIKRWNNSLNLKQD